MSGLGLLAPLPLLRSITRELRHALPAGSKLQQLPSVTFMMGEFKKNTVTQEQHCKHTQEMLFLADTYNTYLGAQRKWRDVQQEYHAAGERSVSSTAHRVGLTLPDEPKIEGKKLKAVKEMKPAGWHPRYD